MMLLTYACEVRFHFEVTSERLHPSYGQAALETLLPVRTLIVDDEPSARMRLRKLLDEDPEIEIVAECGDGAKAMEAIREHRPALIFLDIAMPNANGLDVLNSLDLMPVTIFVTAFREYAVSAFEACAFDYLLKPFTRARFFGVLARAKRQVTLNSTPAQTQRTGADKVALANELLIVKNTGKTLFIRTSELVWIEAEKDYVRLHTRRGSHFVRETMSNVEKRLPTDSFVRIHRSAIVNMREVSELTPVAGGDSNLLLRDGTELTLSRRYRAAFDGLLEREMRGERSA